MQYRKEIDGLRALAIIPVIFYHAGVSFFKGGFVGVDVFFVISGYLITSIVLADLDSNSFSFSQFYERRLRRIFPALFIVCAACFLFAFKFIPPSDMQDFSKSLLRTFIFISNIYFYKHSGYFDQASELKPLLHTWSLSVEEQYYIFFPPLIIFIYKFIGKKHVKSILIALVVASLALSQYLIAENPLASYYLIQSRFWEIMLGAILAVGVTQCEEIKTLWWRMYHEFAAFLGVMLILGSSIFFSNETMFPGVMALLPTVGAALIITYAREGTLTARILQLKGFVLIGLISYSLYLWHQPVLAMARIVVSRELSQFEIFSLIAVIFSVAYISWKWVEAPFRDRQIITNKRLVIFISIGFLCVIAVGNWGSIDGLKSRFAGLYEAHPKLLGVQTKYECIEDHVYSSKYLSVCSFGDIDSKSTIALWGDSHAEMLIGALDKQFKFAHIKGVRILAKGCGPIPGVQDEDFVYSMLGKRKDCEQKYEAAYEFIRNNVQSTIISIRWTYHIYPVVGLVDRMHFDNFEGGVEPGKSKQQLVVQSDGRLAIDGEAKKVAIFKLFKNLSGRNKPIIVVYPVPEVGWDIPRKILMDLILGRQEAVGHITTSHDVYIKRNQFIIDVIDEWTGSNVYRIRPDDVFCQQPFVGRCVAKIGEISYYSDTNHLSSEGALLLSRKISESFAH